MSFYPIVSGEGSAPSLFHSLDKVKRLFETLAMVNCTAVGYVALPNNIGVEIECIFEVE